MNSINNDIEQQHGRPQSGLLAPAPVATTQEEFITNTEFVDRFNTETPVSRPSIIKMADRFPILSTTVDRSLKRLSETGAITSSGGLYWLPEA